MSRAYTEEEVQEKFLNHIRLLVEYWSGIEDYSKRQVLDGLAFSILNIFDGTTLELPALDISCSPHPEDKEYHQKEGENWYEPGMIINDCMLHEMWYVR